MLLLLLCYYCYYNYYVTVKNSLAEKDCLKLTNSQLNASTKMHNWLIMWKKVLLWTLFIWHH